MGIDRLDDPKKYPHSIVLSQKGWKRVQPDGEVIDEGAAEGYIAARDAARDAIGYEEDGSLKENLRFTKE